MNIFYTNAIHRSLRRFARESIATAYVLKIASIGPVRSPSVPCFFFGSWERFCGEPIHACHDYSAFRHKKKISIWRRKAFHGLYIYVCCPSLTTENYYRVFSCSLACSEELRALKEDGRICDGNIDCEDRTDETDCPTEPPILNTTTGKRE